MLERGRFDSFAHTRCAGCPQRADRQCSHASQDCSTPGESKLLRRFGSQYQRHIRGVADAFSERCEALGATEKGDDDQAVRLARRDIQAVLEKARDILSDTHMKAAYQRSQQLSLDFDDDAVRARLLKEHLLSFAQKKLDASQFEDAQDALSRVVRDHPDDEDVHIKLGWAAFLNSDRSPTQADEAATHINRAISLNRESDVAYLTLGKIYRLADAREKALRNLKKATELNPDSSEAWALLRNVNAHKGGPATGGLKLQLDVGDGLVPAMGLTLFALAILYIGANIVPGGPKACLRSVRAPLPQ